MYGGDDDDLIVGGTGLDQLYGGAGADIFKFSVIADSSGGGDANRDFVSGADRLNLNDITGGNAAKVNWVGVTGATILFVDADLDGNTDMTITLFGTPTLSSSDIIY